MTLKVACCSYTIPWGHVAASFLVLSMVLPIWVAFRSKSALPSLVPAVMLLKDAGQVREKLAVKQEKPYFPDSLEQNHDLCLSLKASTVNNVFPNSIRHQNREDTDDNKRQKAMWKSSIISFSVHANLTGRVLEVLACLPVDMTCHQAAILLGTVSNQLEGYIFTLQWHWQTVSSLDNYCSSLTVTMLPYFKVMIFNIRVKYTVVGKL